MTRSSTAMITALLSTSHSRNFSSGPGKSGRGDDVTDYGDEHRASG